MRRSTRPLASCSVTDAGAENPLSNNSIALPTAGEANSRIESGATGRGSGFCTAGTMRASSPVLAAKPCAWRTNHSAPSGPWRPSEISVKPSPKWAELGWPGTSGAGTHGEPVPRVDGTSRTNAPPR